MDKAADTQVVSPRSTVRVDQGSFVVFVGIWAWLFTIGFLHLSFWRGVLAILLWPYYLGTTFSPPPH